jgi:hypothetical protein
VHLLLSNIHLWKELCMIDFINASRMPASLRHVFSLLVKLLRKLRGTGSSYSILLQLTKNQRKKYSRPALRHSRIIYAECKTESPLPLMDQNEVPLKINDNFIRILRYANEVDVTVDGISMFYTSAKTYMRMILTSVDEFPTVERSLPSKNYGRMVIVRQCRLDSSAIGGLKKAGYGLLRNNNQTRHLNQWLRRQRWRLDSILPNISKKHLILSTERNTHGE